MIRYALHCEKGHEFEAWFRSSQAFDEQAGAGQVICPGCGSSQVSKALMAPALGKARPEPPAPAPQGRDAAASAPPADSHALAADPKSRALAEAIRRLRRHVAENADYVGARFPEEARRIHNEEGERRSIYGEASPKEAKELVEEGIEIHPLPRLPDEQN